MSREVSVEEQIAWFEERKRNRRDDIAWLGGQPDAILSSLRELALLREVANKAHGALMSWDQPEATQRLAAALGALRDHDKLGKDEKCRSCGGRGTLGCTYPDHGDSTSDHACGDETCGACSGTGRIKLGKEG
jgi:hypothetical protein